VNSGGPSSGTESVDGAVVEALPVTVTALRESPRAPGRYVVTVSDGKSFVVGVAALSDAGATRIGAVLSADAIQRLARESAVSDLVARAVAMLARSRRTRRELEIRLRRREPDRTRIATALDRLEQAGILSDTEVARAEASSRLRRGEAPARVRGVLRSKGIGGADAGAAVAQAIDENGFDELTACMQVAEKRMRAMSKLDPVVARRRLIGFLQRRGFDGSTIRRVLQAERSIDQNP